MSSSNRSQKISFEQDELSERFKDAVRALGSEMETVLSHMLSSDVKSEHGRARIWLEAQNSFKAIFGLCHRFLPSYRDLLASKTPREQLSTPRTSETHLKHLNSVLSLQMEDSKKSAKILARRLRRTAKSTRILSWKAKMLDLEVSELRGRLEERINLQNQLAEIKAFQPARGLPTSSTSTKEHEGESDDQQQAENLYQELHEAEIAKIKQDAKEELSELRNKHTDTLKDLLRGFEQATHQQRHQEVENSAQAIEKLRNLINKVKRQSKGHNQAPLRKAATLTPSPTKITSRKSTRESYKPKKASRVERTSKRKDLSIKVAETPRASLQGRAKIRQTPKSAQQPERKYGRFSMGHASPAKKMAKKRQNEIQTAKKKIGTTIEVERVEEEDEGQQNLDLPSPLSSDDSEPEIDSREPSPANSASSEEMMFQRGRGISMMPNVGDLEDFRDPFTNQIMTIEQVDLTTEDFVESDRKAQEQARGLSINQPKHQGTKNFKKSQNTENRLKTAKLTFEVETAKEELEEGLIGGDTTHLAVKDHSSYLIATNRKGMKVIDKNRVLFAAKLPSEANKLKDAIYCSKTCNFYLLCLNNNLYRKDINKKDIFLFLDSSVILGIRDGACMRFSADLKRLFINKDYKSISAVNLATKKLPGYMSSRSSRGSTAGLGAKLRTVEASADKAEGSEIVDFELFGMKHDKVVSVTKDGWIHFYEFSVASKGKKGRSVGISGKFKLQLMQATKEEANSITLCDKRVWMLVDLVNRTPKKLTSRTLVCRMSASGLEPKFDLDASNGPILRSRAMVCLGTSNGVGYFLGMGVKVPETYLLGLDVESGVLVELDGGRVGHGEDGVVAVERLGKYVYYAGSGGKVMRLGFDGAGF